MKKQLILATVFSIVLFGLGFTNSAQALGEPIPGIDIVVKKNPGGTVIKVETGADGSYNFTRLEPGNYDISISGQPVQIITVDANGTISGKVISDDSGKPKLVALGAGAIAAIIWTTTITSADLGVDNVGTLPTSNFYFFKQWSRGIQRFFTLDSVAKVQLELNITNQIAAELLEVEKTYDACAANALGGGKSCKPEDKVGSVKNALQNFTDAQERLNLRITTINGTSNIQGQLEDLLKEVDDKTAKHVDLLEQVSVRVTFARTGTCGAFCQQYEDLQSVVDNALNNTRETFTVTVTPVNDAPSLKQKAEEQIKRAGIAIVTVDVVSPTGGETGLKVAVSKTINGYEMVDAITAKAKEHLTEAKKAFVEGKYGEAYGQARSAEAMVASIGTITNDDSEVSPKAITIPVNGDTIPEPNETFSTKKESPKIESPKPSPKPSASPTPKPTPEKTETPASAGLPVR